ncbi:MAG: hypothetical protein AAF226_09125, partial [Verrucomicrobiota bacterium]
IDLYSGVSYSLAMNDETHHPEDEQQPQTSAEESAKDMKDAFKNGASDAKKAVQEAFPKVKEEFGQGVHDIAYALGYAANFGFTLVKEFAPENIHDGFSEGANAGEKAAQEVVKSREVSDAPAEPA